MFYIYYINISSTQMSAVTWRTAHEHIVPDAFHFKKSLLRLLVRERQASQKWCLSSRHLTACGDYNRNICENTSSVYIASKYWKMTVFNF